MVGKGVIMHIISGLDDGGAEAVLCRLCGITNPKRHIVVSLTGSGKYGPILRSSGVRVVCLGMKRGFFSLSGFVLLLRLIKTVRPMLIQTWMYHADLLGGIAAIFAGGCPVVWGIRHSDLSRQHTRFLTRAIARLCAWLSGVLPDRIVTCGHAAKRAHVSLGYDESRMIEIANGYDLSKFRFDLVGRTSLRAALGVKEDVALLGMVARFDPQKDHINLLTALALASDAGCEFHCVLAGRGVDAHNKILMDACLRLGISNKVTFLGRRDDIPCLMSAIDIFILSSLSEGFPNVVAEAMACGTPCVVTNVGDAKEIVGEDGYIVPARDHKALSFAIQRAMADRCNKGKWNEVQAKSSLRIRARYALPIMALKFARVWREVVQEHASIHSTEIRH